MDVNFSQNPGRMLGKFHSYLLGNEYESVVLKTLTVFTLFSLTPLAKSLVCGLIKITLLHNYNYNKNEKSNACSRIYLTRNVFSAHRVHCGKDCWVKQL